MGWLGKIIAGSIGFVAGGPLGAIIGVVLGHHAIDSGRRGFSSLTDLERKQSIYFVASFSMLGKLAKADGIVTHHEIDIIDNVMVNHLKLHGDARKLAVEIFNEAKDSPASFEEFAQQFYDEFLGEHQMMMSMIELLLLVAMADNQLHSAEKLLIEKAVHIFGLENEYEAIKARFVGTPLDINKYYQMLGCEKGDSLAVVKKKYRRLAMEFHPDRVLANGVPEEFAEASQNRFKEIQEAYDHVSRDINH